MEITSVSRAELKIALDRIAQLQKKEPDPAVWDNIEVLIYSVVEDMRLIARRLRQKDQRERTSSLVRQAKEAGLKP